MFFGDSITESWSGEAGPRAYAVHAADNCHTLCRENARASRPPCPHAGTDLCKPVPRAQGEVMCHAPGPSIMTDRLSVHARLHPRTSWHEGMGVPVSTGFLAAAGPHSPGPPHTHADTHAQPIPTPHPTLRPGVDAVFRRHFARWNASVMAVGGDQTAHLLWRLLNGEAPRKNKVGPQRGRAVPPWTSGSQLAGLLSCLSRAPVLHASPGHFPWPCWLPPARALPGVQPRVAVVLIGTNDLGAAAWEAPDVHSAEAAVMQAVPGVTLRWVARAPPQRSFPWDWDSCWRARAVRTGFAWAGTAKNGTTRAARHKSHPCEIAPAAPAFDPYKCSMRRCPPACPQGAEHAAPAEGPPSQHARRAHGPAAAWRRLARRARPLALGLHPGL